MTNNLKSQGERGGLSLCEAAAIERRPWRKMTADEAMEAEKGAHPCRA